MLTEEYVLYIFVTSNSVHWSTEASEGKVLKTP
jgi:hypothetical protein